jgi:hypothetical protein
MITGQRQSCGGQGDAGSGAPGRLIVTAAEEWSLTRVIPIVIGRIGTWL